jgi:glucose-6-phosphate 1-epimerase
LTIDGTARGGPLVVDYRLDQSLAPRAPSFPHDFEARLRVVFAADHLQIDLDTRNTGASAFAFEAALHSYLVVGDIRRAVLSGLDGADYLDKAAGAPAGLQRQSGDVVFTGETDRVYASRAKVEILDPVLGRRLIVAKEGSGQTVIWNPWIDKAKAMADFGDEEWTGMVCVEAGAIGEGAVRLAPGGRHRLSQRVEAAALV